jgi:3',5'-nucleoside bisphosphate phosphatase
MIDLHAHSSFSDGSDSPAALAAAATRAGLRAVALTDHDGVGGVAAFLRACRQHGVTGLSGVEVSVEVPAGTLHLLGYGIDPGHAALLENLERIRDGRVWRNDRILERLAELGVPVSRQEVAAHAGDDVVGRPHIARALIARGYVSSTQEAFDRFLAKGQPAYVDRFRLAPEEAVRLIRAAGGLPVLAHPSSWEKVPSVLAAKVAALRDAGLGGIEAYYPEHSVEDTVAYLRLAQQLGLVATGGTDYHGSMKPGLLLGSGTGGFEVPDALLAPLLAAIPGRVGLVV